mgnify:CR=1 FL=1
MKVWKRPIFDLVKIGSDVYAQLKDIFDGGIIPPSDNTLVLGTASRRWANGHVNEIEGSILEYTSGKIDSPKFGFVADVPILGTLTLAAHDGNYQFSLVNTSGSDQYVDLPDSPPDGTRYRIRNTQGSSDNVIVRCQGSDTYEDGSTEITMQPEEPPYITDEYDLSAGPGAAPVLSQPSTPQHVQGIIRDHDESITTFSIEIVGTSGGVPGTTETFTLAGDGRFWTSANEYSVIDSVSINAITDAGAGDTFQLVKDYIDEYTRFDHIYSSGKWYVNW